MSLARWFALPSRYDVIQFQLIYVRMSCRIVTEPAVEGNRPNDAHATENHECPTPSGPVDEFLCSHGRYNGADQRRHGEPSLCGSAFSRWKPMLQDSGR